MIIAVAVVIALLAVLVGVLLAAFDRPRADAGPAQRPAESRGHDWDRGGWPTWSAASADDRFAVTRR
jgi:hypothetical protein